MDPQIRAHAPVKRNLSLKHTEEAKSTRTRTALSEIQATRADLEEDSGLPEVWEDGVGGRRGCLPRNPRRGPPEPRRGPPERAGGDPRRRGRRAVKDHDRRRRASGSNPAAVTGRETATSSSPLALAPVRRCGARERRGGEMLELGRAGSLLALARWGKF